MLFFLYDDSNDYSQQPRALKVNYILNLLLNKQHKYENKLK